MSPSTCTLIDCAILPGNSGFSAFRKLLSYFQGRGASALESCVGRGLVSLRPKRSKWKSPFDILLLLVGISPLEILRNESVGFSRSIGVLYEFWLCLWGCVFERSSKFYTLIFRSIIMQQKFCILKEKIKLTYSIREWPKIRFQARILRISLYFFIY